MKLTVIMQFMNLCSLNFQSRFSSSPRLTHEKKKKILQEIAPAKVEEFKILKYMIFT
jgi:hypothetical protein